MSRKPENDDIKEVVMTLAEQWKQEGIEKGIEKGIKKGIEMGIEKGKIGIVSKLLTIRFREDTETWIKQLDQLSSKDLDTVSERILTKNSLSDVFQGIL